MKKRVVCAGTFDHFHPGHEVFLRQAKMLGTELVVIVAQDETVKRIKGFIPTHSTQERYDNVVRSGIADSVVFGHLGDDIFVILDELHPHVLALGYDQRIPETTVRERCPWCEVVRLEAYHPEKYKSSFYRKLAAN
ncbi:MAG TPA: adenylyltransferase/cytidyltransferase family protein [Dissulfurispiraceae bacterium]|nr:adenylyltransferase/cytidyltransferase family protein [Dissulfurispiraceae bacterium]